MAYYSVKGFDPYIGSSYITRRPYESFENQRIRDNTQVNVGNFTYSILFYWDLPSFALLNSYALYPFFTSSPNVVGVQSFSMDWTVGVNDFEIRSILGSNITFILPFPFNQLCNLTVSSTPVGRYAFLNGVQINATTPLISTTTGELNFFFIDQSGGIPSINDNDKIIINGGLLKPAGTPVNELAAISTVSYLEEQLYGQVSQRRKSIFTKIFNNETPVNPPVSVPLVGQEVRTDQYRFYYPRPNHMSFKLRGGING